MRRQGTPVTFAVMVLAEGDTGRTVYGVFRGHLRGGRAIGLHTAVQVGAVEHRRGEPPEGYRDMARRFEAPGWPAFAWDGEEARR